MVPGMLLACAGFNWAGLTLASRSRVWMGSPRQQHAVQKIVRHRCIGKALRVEVQREGKSRPILGHTEAMPGAKTNTGANRQGARRLGWYALPCGTILPPCPQSKMPSWMQAQRARTQRCFSIGMVFGSAGPA